MRSWLPTAVGAHAARARHRARVAGRPMTTRPDQWQPGSQPDVGSYAEWRQLERRGHAVVHECRFGGSVRDLLRKLSGPPEVSPMMRPQVAPRARWRRPNSAIMNAEPRASTSSGGVALCRQSRWRRAHARSRRRRRGSHPVTMATRDANSGRMTLQVC